MPSHNNDTTDLASFGYKQELERSLGSFSTFAAGFSYISILTGMFQLFYLGFGTGGAAFFWSWPLMFIGHLMIALCFAELSSQYPLSGVVYQWAKHIGNPFIGWMTGWIYFSCLVVTLAAVSLAMQNTLPQIWSSFQIINDQTKNAVLLGCILLVLSTLINSIGVKLMALINNIGVFSEILGITLLIILLAIHQSRQPSEVLFDTMGKGTDHPLGYFGSFLTATALTASYVMYGYDTAGSLAEETHNPRKKAPMAIIQAITAASVAGLLVLLFSLMATQDLHNPQLSLASGGLPFIVTSVLGSTLGKLLLVFVIFAIFVCTLAVHTGAVRLAYSMARDKVLPFSKILSRVSASTNTPTAPVLLVGFFAMLILIINIQFPKIVEVITSVAILWANLSYLIVIAVLLKTRIKNRDIISKSVFSLGRFGIPINILALVWSIFMVINVGWPRTDLYGDGGARFNPIIYTMILVGVGVLYYFVTHLFEGKHMSRIFYFLMIGFLVNASVLHADSAQTEGKLDYLLKLDPNKVTIAELRSRAEFLEENYQKYHQYNGILWQAYWGDLNGSAPTRFGTGGDSAKYTGMYLAASVFRFNLTKASQDLDKILVTLRGIHILTHISGKPGVLAKCAFPADQPTRWNYPQDWGARIESNVIYESPTNVPDILNPNANYEKMIFYTNATRDQLIGMLFGLGVLLKELKTDNFEKSLHAKIEQAIDIGAQITKDLYQWTSTHDWVLRDHEERIDNNAAKLNNPHILLLMSVYRQALKVRGSQKHYESFSRKIYVPWFNYAITRNRYGLSELFFFFSNYDSYYAWNLRFMTIYTLHLLENSDVRKKAALDYVDSYMWRHIKDHQNPHFIFLYLAMGGEDKSKLGDALFSLKAVTQRPSRSWSSPLMGKDHMPGIFSTIFFDNIESVLPAHLREHSQFFLWKEEPFNAGSDLDIEGRNESTGLDIILPYWMGRYYNFIDAD